MVSTLRHFFEVNSILVLFVYGQVFFVMGLAVALQSRRHSRLELGRSLGWLAGFGLAHGLHEWGMVFIPIQATYVELPVVRLLQVAQVILLALSFGFLLQFGAELWRQEHHRLMAVPVAVMLLWGLLFVMPGLTRPADFDTWHRQASTWARYLIGFPAGLLAALALYHQAEKQIRPLNLEHIYRTLRVAGVSLVAYSLLGGLIVPGGSFWPANWLNEANVLAWLGVPAPVFRSVAGLVMAVAVIRALEVFDLEVDRLIEQMETEQSLVSERERIGRELHDGAIQQVYTAGLIVESARNKLAEEPEVARQRLERAMTALNEAIAGLRVHMSQLRPGPATISLPEGLRQLTADPRLTALMEVKLVLDMPAEASLNAIRTAHVLAIVNEALANAARHAAARHVTVTAAQANQALRLSVHDDGRGFAGTPEGDGYGLRNMRDRARLLGGHLSIDSPPGKGTTVTLVAPWEDSTWK